MKEGIKNGKLEHLKPSNKIAPVIIVVIFIITASISYSNYKARNLSEASPEPTQRTDLLVQVDNKLEDGDSFTKELSDWEQILWNLELDSFNVDNYEPGQIDEDSLSTELSLRIFSEIATIQEDQSLSNSEKEKLVSELLNDLDGRLEIGNKYDRRNFITFSSSNMDRVKNFGNNFSRLYLYTIYEMLYASVYYEFSHDYGQTTPFIVGYKNIAEELFRLQVPDELLEVYVTFTNNNYRLSILYSNLTEEDTDPIKVLFSMKRLDSILNEQKLLLGQIANYILNSDIIYNEEDPGYLLKGVI